MGEFPDVFHDSDIRKEQIEYKKWVVNLTVIVLTISLSLVGFYPNGLRHKWILIAGWIALALSLFEAFILVKVLVEIPLVLNTPKEQRGHHHHLFLRNPRRIIHYGQSSHSFFLAGIFLLVLGFLVNL